MVVFRDSFDELQRELGRMLESAFGSVASSVGVYPPVNIFDAGDAYVVRAELPGVDPRQVEIEVENETLTIRGERTLDESKREGAYHRRERGTGRFRRVVRIPGRLDSGGVEAESRHGVLTIRLPKAKEARPRRVEIKAA